MITHRTLETNGAFALLHRGSYAGRGTILVELLVLGVGCGYEDRESEAAWQSEITRKGQYFSDLPLHVRQRAETLLRGWRIQWGRHNMPNWRLALLVGQARRLAKIPPGSSWGRRMAAAKGGYAVQRRYRLEGRNPTEAATAARQAASAPRKQAGRNSQGGRRGNHRERNLFNRGHGKTGGGGYARGKSYRRSLLPISDSLPTTSTARKTGSGIFA